MARTRAISSNELLALESPIEVYPTDEPVWSMVYPGVSSVANDGTLAMLVYRGSDDVTSSYTSGSMSASSNVVVLKKMVNLVGGDVLHVTVQATCDGVLRTVGFDVFVKRLSGR